MIDLKKLEMLLSVKSQYLVCYPAGGRAVDKEAVYKARIHHEVSPAIDPEQVKNLEAALGAKNDLVALLSKYGSVRLYCDEFSNTSGFYIANPEEWEQLAEEMQDWIDQLSDDEKNNIVPEWLDDALVFGERPESGNLYLLLAGNENKECGAVFEFDHDGFEFVKVANSVQEFIDSFCDTGEQLIDLLKSYARFSDGQTEIQWIAKRYVAEI